MRVQQLQKVLAPISRQITVRELPRVRLGPADHPLDVLGEDVELQVDQIAYHRGTEVSMFAGVWMPATVRLMPLMQIEPFITTRWENSSGKPTSSR